MSTRRRLVSMAGIGCILALGAPLSVDPASPRRPVRLNEACGQATSCIPSARYICSTYHADYRDMACYTGCGEKQ